MIKNDFLHIVSMNDGMRLRILSGKALYINQCLIESDYHKNFWKHDLFISDFMNTIFIIIYLVWVTIFNT